MKIVSAQLFIYFHSDHDIRRKLFELETTLGDNFVTPFPIVRNIPDRANDAIARFETTSLNGNSELKISPTFIQLDTTFTEDYQTSSENIKKYYDKKIEIIKKIVSEQTSTFYGFVVNLEEKFDSEDQVLKTIGSHFKSEIMDTDTIDVAFTYSRLINEHFCNTKIEKYNLFQGIFKNDKNKIPVPVPGPTEYGVKVQLDINTKPLFRRTSETFNFQQVSTLIHNISSYSINHDTTTYLSGSTDFKSIIGASDAS